MLTLSQLKDRKTGIGASECAAVLGIDPYTTPYELWLMKTGRMERDLSNNEAVIMGNMLEPVIAKRYAQLTNQRVCRVNAAFRHKDLPFMLCHLDRKVIGLTKAVEIKTANPFSKQWGEAGSDEVPLQYVAQIQHQLAVTGWDSADLIVFRGTTDLRIYPFVRADNLINVIINKITHFWNYHILQDMPPAPTTREDVNSIYPLNNGNYIATNSDIISAIKILEETKKKIKALENDKKTYETHIINYIKDNDGIRQEDEIIATYKANKNGTRTLRINEV